MVSPLSKIQLQPFIWVTNALVRRTKNSGFNETCEGNEQKTSSTESADVEQQNSSDRHSHSQTSSEVTELPETSTTKKKNLHILMIDKNQKLEEKAQKIPLLNKKQLLKK